MNRDSMIETIEQLGPLVEAGIPGRTALKFEMEQASFCGRDDFEPSGERMRRAIQLYRALPADEKRRIQNGWAGDVTERPTRKELERDFASLSSRQVDLVLSIGRCAAGCIAASDVESFKQWDFSDSPFPVELRVRFGTTKREVLDTIDAIRNAVRDWFDEMTAHDASSIAKLESALARSRGREFRAEHDKQKGLAGASRK